MKFLRLLVMLAVITGCGIDARYSHTLDEEANDRTTEVVAGTVAGVIVVTCMIAGVKKRCIPFAKKIAKIDDASKQARKNHKQNVEELRKLYEEGEISKEEFNTLKSRRKTKKLQKEVEKELDEIDTFEIDTSHGKRLFEVKDLRDSKVKELTDKKYEDGLIKEGKLEELIKYREDVIRKADDQLVSEGKITKEELQTIQELDEKGRNLAENLD